MPGTHQSMSALDIMQRQGCYAATPTKILNPSKGSCALLNATEHMLHVVCSSTSRQFLATSVRRDSTRCEVVSSGDVIELKSYLHDASRKRQSCTVKETTRCNCDCRVLNAKGCEDSTSLLWEQICTQRTNDWNNALPSRIASNIAKEKRLVALKDIVSLNPNPKT